MRKIILQVVFTLVFTIGLISVMATQVQAEEFTVEELEKFANDESWVVRSMVAGNPNTPVETLEKLSRDESWCTIRGGVAGNPNTSVEILERLSNDKDSFVRGMVADNPNTPATRKTRQEMKDEKTPIKPATTVNSESFTIVSINTKVTESNSTWSKFAWKLVLRNNTNTSASFRVVIEWLDADGFVVDDDTEYNLIVPANYQKTFTGYDLINAKVAGNIRSVQAKVRKH